MPFDLLKLLDEVRSEWALETGVTINYSGEDVMRAYQFVSPVEGLVSVELPDPVPAAGEVLLDVKAAGVCMSDVHILNGHGDHWLRKRPIVLGHEVAGTVAGLGPGVDDFSIGEPVAVALIAHPIEKADFANAIGLGFDGGYALRTVAPAQNLVRIPPGVSFTHAAIATDSIATAYHAVVSESAVERGSTVVIVGLGGLGLNGVRIARLNGATVYGIDVDTTTFDTACTQGAVACYTSASDIAVPIDTVVDFAGMGTTTAEAISAVRPGGRVVVVGLGVDQATIPIGSMITKNVQLRGSLGASLDDLEAVLRLLADGKLNPVVEEFPFGDLEPNLRRLERGEVRGRLVTCPCP